MSSPSCLLAGRGSQRQCLNFPARGAAQSSGAAPGRAGLWAPRGSSSSSGSRRSAPSPAFQAITWCGRGSAPDAFKEVAPQFCTWDWSGKAWVWGTELRPRPGAGSHSPACAHAGPAPTHPRQRWCRVLTASWFSASSAGNLCLPQWGIPGALCSPLLRSPSGAPGANRGTDLPKVTPKLAPLLAT